MEQGMGTRSRVTEIKCSAGCGRTVASIPPGQEVARAGAPGSVERSVTCPGCKATTVVRSVLARPGGRNA